MLGVGILEDRPGILLGVLAPEPLRLTWCLGLGLGDGAGEWQVLGRPEPPWVLWTGLTILGPLAGLLGTLK